MIESVSIRNFQKHEQFELEFDKITTLYGPSDRGKSAIVRALRWLCFNKPQGNSYIRDGCESAEVILQVDGHRLSRQRGATNNLYRLDEREYSAFGNQVPVDIERLLNLSEDSFQLQHDPAYWLTLSSGQVAKELNKVINLELIDKCQSNISSELRKAKTTVEVTKTRLGEAEKEVEALNWVREANESFQIIEEKSEVINDKRIKLNRMAQIQLEAAGYQEVVQKGLQLKPERLLGKLKNLLGLRQRLNRLQELNIWIDGAKGELCLGRKAVKKAKLDLEEKMVGSCPVCGTQM